ncbi:FMN-binding protein [Streptomyces sp. NPDC048639]|uniref:FMN-binding protein n=1 Tax=Streptomyces sp. NPDC048639 TaxID=3365581 RepID=UPI00371DC605
MKKHPMRHILLSTAATVSGVVMLLALKAPGLPSSSTQASGLPAAPPASAPPAGGGQPEQQGGSGQEEPGQQQGNPPQQDGQQQDGQQSAEPGGQQQDDSESGDGGSGGGQKPGGGGARTVVGEAVQTDYGPVQVRLTVAGGRITEAAAAQAPSSTPMSKQITSDAVPQLNQKAVTAQGQDIDAVSGATYTSEGYTRSLQSALDKAGV